MGKIISSSVPFHSCYTFPNVLWLVLPTLQRHQWKPVYSDQMFFFPVNVWSARLGKGRNFLIVGDFWTWLQFSPSGKSFAVNNTASESSKDWVCICTYQTLEELLKEWMRGLWSAVSRNTLPSFPYLTLTAPWIDRKKSLVHYNIFLFLPR